MIRPSSSPSSLPSLRRTLALLFFVGSAAAAVQAGCGNSGNESTFVTPSGDDASVEMSTSGGFGGDSGGGANDGGTTDPDALGTLVVMPPAATIAITIVNGVVTANMPVAFSASYSGNPVAATWLFDRGELGDVASTGVFTANGKNVGEGTLTARFGSREGSAKIKVTIASSQNGALAGVDAGAGGFGGLGGVGGEPLGPPVDAATETKLKGPGTAPANAAELGFLYPYDNTVWPRGLLPPVLMWQSTHDASAVWVKLAQGNFTYEGTFSYSAQPAGSAARQRVRLEDAVWKAITGGNQGDPLIAQVKILGTDGIVYGPISLTWKVASGVLKGTVYYNSYDSLITTGGGAATGGVIAIKPRSPDPVLAVPAQMGKCHVCHTVSSDGSTLWAQDDSNGDYANGASYDLTKGGARTPYVALGAGGIPANNRKFVWSAPYPDGSFALASSRFAREAYTQGDSKLFARSDASEVVSTGLGGVVTSAVTPAFSPDGRKVAFNFWEGPGAGGVTAGAGRSLDVFDFSCGAPAGSTACTAAGGHAFANLREIYKNPATYPSWPSFLPDGKAVVFNNELARGTCSGDPADRTSIYNCQLTTWYSAKSALWIAKDVVPNDAQALVNANGIGLPTNVDHPDDTQLNYQPTVNPVPSGGYYWVVFTSRRIYGNLLTGKPFGLTGGDGTPQKKLWVAAIDIASGAIDPSHPAFYLPGQELNAGNSRGFWVVDPCKSNGNSCESGDECCNGFCRKDPDGGALVCQDKPPGTMCVQEFEKCVVDGDCCDPTQKCIAGKCAQQAPVVK
jgi:hypothetical protein